jgi:hypothetical protein
VHAFTAYPLSWTLRERFQKEADAMSAKTTARRFAILISPLWSALLLPFGVTGERAFVEIEDDELHVRFGWVFDQTFRVKDIEGVDLSHWPVWAGIGPRINFRGLVGLVGTYVNTVELRFKKPQRVRLLVPVSCQRLLLSIEDPHDFMDALRKRPADISKAA